MLLRIVAMFAAIGLVLPATPQVADEQVLRALSMPEGQLIHRVDPEYPSVALQHRITGTVRFSALIGKDGHIESLRLVSGHPLLVGAAREAVQQWAYRPTLVDGKPTQVITQIDVYFRLDVNGNPVKDGGHESKSAAVL
jgi:protein TonB